MVIRGKSSTLATTEQRATGPSVPERGDVDWKFVIFMTGVAVACSLAVLAFVSSAGTPTNMNDFYKEVWPSFVALAHGHVVRFFQLAPAYVGSLVLRAPFALIPTIWGGGVREVFFAAGLPCMLALSAFCVWLAQQPRSGRRVGPANAIGPVVLCILSPVILIGMGDGHPEELLGGVLCVAAVICATRGRAGLAGLLVALAVINKSWALVAVPVVLAVMPSISRRTIAVLIAAAIAAVLVVVAADSNGVNGLLITGQIGAIFNPPQLLWIFGSHAWVAQHARAGILLFAVLASILWRRRHAPVTAGASAVPDALLLLALVLFVRAAFDPWNNLYYHEPFLFALIAWEATSGRRPVLMTLYTVLLLIVVPLKSYPPMSFDTRALAYAVVAIPTLVWLAWLNYMPRGSGARFWRTVSHASPRRVATDEPTAA